VPRPGVDVEVVEDFTPGEANLDTGQGLFVGATERGAPIMTVHNMSDYKTKAGGTVGGGYDMYNGMLEFFQEGGTTAIISRTTPAAAALATGELGDWAVINAKDKGLWGNQVKVTAQTPIAVVGANPDGIRLRIDYNGVQGVEVSPAFSDIESATRCPPPTRRCSWLMGRMGRRQPPTTSRLWIGSSSTTDQGRSTPRPNWTRRSI
jgi:hypothetical protein